MLNIFMNVMFCSSESVALIVFPKPISKHDAVVTNVRLWCLCAPCEAHNHLDTKILANGSSRHHLWWLWKPGVSIQ